MKEDKIIYVDFCNTITNFTTLSPFFNFIFSKSFISNFINMFFRGLSYFNLLSLQDRQLQMISGLKESYINMLAKDFYYQEIQPNLNKIVLNIIKDYAKHGYKVVIVSGALKEYIHHLSDEIPIHKVIAKSIEYRDSRATGKYINGPCYYHDKVIKIEKFEYSLNSNITERVSISDCEDDIPMLLYANKQYVVNPQNNEFKEFVNRSGWKII